MDRRTFLCGLTLGVLAGPLTGGWLDVNAPAVGFFRPDPGGKRPGSRSFFGLL
jgi:hypothetical protein